MCRHSVDGSRRAPTPSGLRDDGSSTLRGVANTGPEEAVSGASKVGPRQPRRGAARRAGGGSHRLFGARYGEVPALRLADRRHQAGRGDAGPVVLVRRRRAHARRDHVGPDLLVLHALPQEGRGHVPRQSKYNLRHRDHLLRHPAAGDHRALLPHGRRRGQRQRALRPSGRTDPGRRVQVELAVRVPHLPGRCRNGADGRLSRPARPTEPRPALLRLDGRLEQRDPGAGAAGRSRLSR